MIRKYLDSGATEADGRASAPVGPSLAMPWLNIYYYYCYIVNITLLVLKESTPVTMNVTCSHIRYMVLENFVATFLFETETHNYSL